MAHIMKETARLLRNNATPSEKMLWGIIRKRQVSGYRFNRQYPIPYQYHTERRFFVLDFYCFEKKLAIEVDGSSHNDKTELDKLRDRILHHCEIRVLRVTTDDVENRIEEVKKRIENALSS